MHKYNTLLEVRYFENNLHLPLDKKKCTLKYNRFEKEQYALSFVSLSTNTNTFCN